MAKDFIRPPHPFDLQASDLTALWRRQEMTTDNRHSDAPWYPSTPWHGTFLHGEVRSLVMLATGATGPLESADLVSFRYSEAEALIAVYVARAWGLARNPTSKGMLAGKPAFEAWDMLCARVRSARATSGNWAGWWPGLLKRLGLKAEQVPQEYALCWEAIKPTLPHLRALDDAAWARVVSAAGLVAREPGWRWQYLTLIREVKGDSVPSYLETPTDE